MDLLEVYYEKKQLAGIKTVLAPMFCLNIGGTDYMPC